MYVYNSLTDPSKLWAKVENIRLNNAILKHGKLFPDRKLRDIIKHYRTNSRLNPFVNVGKWNANEIKRFEIVFKEFGKD
jgi:hypothetical protein